MFVSLKVIIFQHISKVQWNH